MFFAVLFYFGLALMLVAIVLSIIVAVKDEDKYVKAVKVLMTVGLASAIVGGPAWGLQHRDEVREARADRLEQVEEKYDVSFTKKTSKDWLWIESVDEGNYVVVSFLTINSDSDLVNGPVDGLIQNVDGELVLTVTGEDGVNVEYGSPKVGKQLFDSKGDKTSEKVQVN